MKISTPHRNAIFRATIYAQLSNLSTYLATVSLIRQWVDLQSRTPRVVYRACTDSNTIALVAKLTTRLARRAFNTPNRPLREASTDDQSGRDFANLRDVSIGERGWPVSEKRRDARSEEAGRREETWVEMLEASRRVRRFTAIISPECANRVSSRGASMIRGGCAFAKSVWSRIREPSRLFVHFLGSGRPPRPRLRGRFSGIPEQARFIEECSPCFSPKFNVDTFDSIRSRTKRCVYKKRMFLRLLLSLAC